MTQLWLGATDNTGGGKDGSRARAQVHERVSLRYLAADCEVTAGALRILLRQWCRYNRIDPRLAPVPVFAWEPGVVWRQNRQFTITVQADVAEGVQGATVADLRALVDAGLVAEAQAGPAPAPVDRA